MLDLTKIVLAKVADDWRHWRELGYDLNVSVNIDDEVLRESNLGSELGKILSEREIPKHKLTLEFANCFKEGQLNDEVAKKLLGLRMKGYDLSIDDYGFDALSKQAVEDLPVDEIKVNRQIIQDLLVQEANQSVVRNAIHLASRYGMRVVAVGIDYIEKPFSIVELIAKTKKISAYQSKRHELASNIDVAETLAQQFIKDAAHYGDIVHFFKNMLHCHDEQQIANELFKFMSQRGLRALVEFRGHNSYSNFDQQNGVCSPIEVNLFELLRNKGRFYDFGRRVIVNDHHVSFLIKNLPDGESRQDHSLDHFSVLLEGMETGYKDILRQRMLNTVMQKMHELAHKLVQVVDSNSRSKTEVLEKYSFELQMSFHQLNLSEEQENHITNIVNEMLKSKDEREESTSAISEEMNDMLASLTQSLEYVKDQETLQDSDNSGDTVELF